MGELTIRELAVCACDAALELDDRFRGYGTEDRNLQRVAQWLEVEFPEDWRSASTASVTILSLALRATGIIGLKTVSELCSIGRDTSAALQAACALGAESGELARLRAFCVILSRTASARQEPLRQPF